MLKGQSCTIQTAERSRVLFQNGVGFDIEVALKLVPPTGIFHRHTHTHTQTHCPPQNGTSAGLNSDVQEVNFVQFIQGYYMQSGSIFLLSHTHSY